MLPAQLNAVQVRPHGSGAQMQSVQWQESARRAKKHAAQREQRFRHEKSEKQVMGVVEMGVEPALHVGAATQTRWNGPE